jgi:lipopolysaccharide/colanic/teichoic acid biosynthesis glycosyltransferase
MGVFASACFPMACVVAGLLVPGRFTQAALSGHLSGRFPLVNVNHRLQRPASQTRILARVGVWDVVWGGASPLLAFLLRDGTIKSPDTVLIYCGIAFAASLFVFQWFQTSSPIFRYFSVRDALDLLKACVLIAALSAVCLFSFTRLDDAPRSIPVLHLFLLASGLLAARLLSRLHQTRREMSLRKATSAAQHVLVVQATRLAWFFSKLIEELFPGEYQIVAVLDERPTLRRRSLNGYPIVGSPAHIERVIDEYEMHGITIDRIVVGAKPEEISLDVWEDVCRVCKAHHIELDVLPDVFMSGLFAEPANVETEPYTEFASASASADSLEVLLSRPFWVVKRALDLAVASIVAVPGVLVSIVVFALALLDVGMPVIFWQQRVGRNGRPLYLYKFRTLQSLYDRRTSASREAQKPSAIGRFLRKTRLDELPQLWNIISGDMSLIGPRPLLPVDQPNGPSIRLSVRPGLSGWAQVCGGKLISVEEKNALDEWYIRHASLSLDISIILRTIGMFFVGDRRDEGAIATALVGKLASFSDEIPAQKTGQLDVFQKRSRRAPPKLRQV